MNYFWIEPQILAVSSAPQQASEIRTLHYDGMCAILTLSLLPITTAPEITLELLNKLDIQVHHVPISDNHPPTFDQADDILHFLTEMHRQDRPVQIHCEAGVSRTGTVLMRSDTRANHKMTSTMTAPEKCPECRAVWSNGQTCEDHFHQMLYWEAEYPAYSEVHHLTVLCYHLQHPSLYSPDRLNEARRLLVEFVERDTSPVEVRQANRARVDSGRRTWKIKATAAARGSYNRSMEWPMVAADVIAGGAEHYCDNVRAWARSLNATLKGVTSG